MSGTCEILSRHLEYMIWCLSMDQNHVDSLTLTAPDADAKPMAVPDRSGTSFLHGGAIL